MLLNLCSKGLNEMVFFEHQEKHVQSAKQKKVDSRDTIFPITCQRDSVRLNPKQKSKKGFENL